MGKKYTKHKHQGTQKALPTDRKKLELIGQLAWLSHARRAFIALAPLYLLVRLKLSGLTLVWLGEKFW